MIGDGDNSITPHSHTTYHTSMPYWFLSKKD